MSDQIAPNASKDLDVIDPDPTDTIDVEGIQSRVRRLRSREFFALMRVLTAGLGQNLSNIKIDTENPDQMTGDIVALFILAVPEATNEFADFCAIVVEAVDPKEQQDLYKRMENPDPGVLIDVLERIATQEKDDLFTLWGKAQAALSRIQSLYQPQKKTGQKGRGRARST